VPQPRRRAAVVTPFFVDRDAVCNDVYHSARWFRDAGWDARVFAIGSESGRETALPVSELGAFIRDPEDLVYFHFSTGGRQLEEAIARLRCRKLLKFHNITPPELFSMWSDELAEASRLGREEMPRIARLPWERVWGDSSFNLQEIALLLAPGTPTGVLPPFHEIAQLLALRRGPRPARALPRLLAVGRIVQSKGHPFLLRMLRYLVHDLGTPVILDIVGKPDHRLLAYLRMLELMVSEFELEKHVSFHGEIDSAALAERYDTASVFLSASEHEGFCVPLVEAMAFGVPVVALGTTAVPETVGGAGIVWEERDPRRFALAVQRLLSTPAEARWLAEQGLRRYAETFANSVIEQRLAADLHSGAPREPALS
jgi:glycosyltransferase involved in cell wall biosynthesis